MSESLARARRLIVKIGSALLATESGEIAFSWTSDHGETQTEVRQITVE